MQSFEESVDSAYIIALRRLGLSEMTKRQAEVYLRRKRFPPQVIVSVLEKLVEFGYIDDKSYISNALHFTTKQRPKSRLLIKHEMKLKGIDPNIIQEYIGLIDDKRQQEMADALALKYVKKYKNDRSQDTKIKISKSLYRKGFDYEAISKALRNAYKID